MSNAATIWRTDRNGHLVEVDLTGFRADPFAVMDRLNALGSADKIAEYCRDRNVHGVAGLSLRCPLAMILLRETGVRPSIGIHDWAPRCDDGERWDGDEIVVKKPYFPLPVHVEAFADRVDTGHYPDLACDPEDVTAEAVAASLISSAAEQ